jgi:hypothetical protein
MGKTNGVVVGSTFKLQRLDALVQMMTLVQEAKAVVSAADGWWQKIRPDLSNNNCPKSFYIPES